MKTVILAGGLGTRLSEETETKPKPMVEIGGRPILWHIMKIYAHYGFTEFIIALGYKGEAIKRYFLDFNRLQNDFTINLESGEVKLCKNENPNWNVHLINTGENTQTGGRLKRIKDFVKNETFMLTYGDGLSNVDISKLVKFHKSKKKLATVTAVRPPSRFGKLEFHQPETDSPEVFSFREKPQASEGWISGGFFVLEPQVIDLIDDDKTIWELEPLSMLASKNQLVAFQHEGFFQPMDTLREKKFLEEMWLSGKAPWKVW